MWTQSGSQSSVNAILTSVPSKISPNKFAGIVSVLCINQCRSHQMNVVRGMDFRLVGKESEEEGNGHCREWERHAYYTTLERIILISSLSLPFPSNHEINNPQCDHKFIDDDPIPNGTFFRVAYINFRK